MAFLSHVSAVNYACTCGELKPISRIYFCRHCSTIRCGFCVCHEVDARFCPTCMENLPAAEAWMKKNCCDNCYCCPVCNHNLITRVTTVQVSRSSEPTADGKEEDKKPEPPKKFYYLNCFGCHWTSRDVGIPDQTSSSSTWPKVENPHTVRINELVEYWKAVAVMDRMLKEKKQPAVRRGYIHLSGMSAAMTRRKVGLSGLTGSPFGLGGLSEIRKPPAIHAALASGDVNDLPKSIFTEAPDLLRVTTLEQRLRSPDVQCESVSEMVLGKRLLLTKRSQRCRECEHNVTKPEYNPSSIKFKIQLSAYYHIPDVHIRSCERLLAGTDAFLVLKLTNPTPNQTTINFFPLTQEDLLNQANGDAEPEPESIGSQPTSLISKPSPFMKITPRPLRVELNSTPVLPNCSVVLPGRDDAAEYDDTTDSSAFNDNPKVVVWRKANKAAVKLAVRPNADVPVGTKVLVGIVMTHSYTNTIIQQKDQQNILHRVKLVLNVGTTEAA